MRRRHGVFEQGQHGVREGKRDKAYFETTPDRLERRGDDRPWIRVQQGCGHVPVPRRAPGREEGAKGQEERRREPCRGVLFRR